MIAAVVGLRVLYCIIVEVDSGTERVEGNRREQKGDMRGFELGNAREWRSGRIYRGRLFRRDYNFKIHKEHNSKLATN